MQAARSKSGSRLARLAEEQAQEDQQRAKSSGRQEDNQDKQASRDEPGGEDGDSDGSGPKVSQGESLPHLPPSCCALLSSKAFLHFKVLQ